METPKNAPLSISLYFVGGVLCLMFSVGRSIQQYTPGYVQTLCRFTSFFSSFFFEICVQVLREGMGQAAGVGAADVLEIVITNALVLDYTGIYKADVGVRGGLISGLGKAGNPDVMEVYTYNSYRTLYVNVPSLFCWSCCLYAFFSGYVEVMPPMPAFKRFP